MTFLLDSASIFTIISEIQHNPDNFIIFKEAKVD